MLSNTVKSCVYITSARIECVYITSARIERYQRTSYGTLQGTLTYRFFKVDIPD